MKKEIVRFENVTMSENDTVFLNNFSFYMTDSEIVGLESINDRGEQELLRLLCSNLPIDAGRIYWKGKLVNSYQDSDNSANMVYRIEQDSSLIESLSVADNVFVMRPGFRKYIINERILREQAMRVLSDLEIDIDINKRVGTLTTLERIAVELTRAYLMGCSLIMIIHPEKLIGQLEYDQFHHMLRKMKELRISVLYVCYHHRIAFQICDRIAIYSSGRIRKIFEREHFSEEYFAPYAVYYDDMHPRAVYEPQEQALDVRKVSYGSLHEFTVAAGRGECVTILDSDKQILDDLKELLSGNVMRYNGSIYYNKREIREIGPDIVEAGVLMLEENPTETFLFESMSYMDNMCFLLDRKIRKSYIKRSYKKSIRNQYYEDAGELIDEKDIRELSLQEKYGLVFNKIDLFHPKILIMQKPFSFGNMYCRLYIIERIMRLKEKGVCVLLLTNNITDCIQVADRIEIVRNGENSGNLKPEEFAQIREAF